jgi:hypothetical protein
MKYLLVVLITATLAFSPAFAYAKSDKGKGKGQGKGDGLGLELVDLEDKDDDDDDEEGDESKEDDLEDGTESDDEEEDTEDEGEEDDDKPGNNGIRHLVEELEERVDILEGLIANADLDDDGYTLAEGDCNDADFDINPGESEILGDGVDNDCDAATTDDGSFPDLVDNDEDGFFGNSPDPAALDCDDENPDVNPWATEISGNGIDDDCDGAIDELD